MNATRKYGHLFFDLDKTLWDFDTNSYETLRGLYAKHKLGKKGVPSFDDFHDVYNIVNADLWEEYREGRTDKASLSLNRFHYSMLEFGVEDTKLAAILAQDYIDGVSEQTRLFPYVFETLKYLHGRYRLHVITNGFMEVQYRKIENTGMGRYFDHIITSEEAGSHKPSILIFQYALERTGAEAGKSLMIGDDPFVDLVGARSAGMDQMFVNYNCQETDEIFTYTIRSLLEIKQIL